MLPGAYLLSVVPDEDIWIQANFKETQIGHMQPGQKAELTFDAYGDTPIEARVDSLFAASGAQFTHQPGVPGTARAVAPRAGCAGAPRPTGLCHPPSGSSSMTADRVIAWLADLPLAWQETWESMQAAWDPMWEGLQVTAGLLAGSTLLGAALALVLAVATALGPRPVAAAARLYGAV
eukprot:gene39863-49265_t